MSEDISAFYLDGEMLTNPVVNEAITGGAAVITGQRTLEEAKDLAILLRSGALPVKMSVLEVRTVGPSLGQDSKDKSIVAFTIGLSLVVLFMLAVYRISGFVADTALLVYVLILLGVFVPAPCDTDASKYSGRHIVHRYGGGCERPHI